MLQYVPARRRSLRAAYSLQPRGQDTSVRGVGDGVAACPCMLEPSEWVGASTGIGNAVF